VFPDERHYAEEIKEDGGGRGLFPRKAEKKFIHSFGGETEKKRQFGRQYLYGRMILKWNLKEYIEEERNGSNRIE